MLIDIAACAQNTLTGNLISGYKPTSRGGDALVGIRNRRNIYGCDAPSPGWGGSLSLEGLYKIPDSPQHDPDYWAALDGEVLFPTIFADNLFVVSGEYAQQWPAITAMGTYPNVAKTQLQAPTCLLEAPQNWYERSRVYVSGNTYSGFAEHYAANPPYHWEQCGTAVPPGPGPSSELFEIAEGEMYLEASTFAAGLVQ
jgi:hypothetical protein